MIPLELLIPFVLATVLLSLAPGPDNLFVLAQSALYGKRTGVFVTLGLCTGLIAHTTAVALGVAVIFQTSAVAFTTLKILGALWLAYLAWQAFRASAGHLQTAVANIPSSGALYRRGIIMNITNPKVSIFFLAFLPQFTSPQQGSLALQIFVLGAVFILVAFIIFSAIAVLSARLSAWLCHSTKAQVVLQRMAGTVFAGLALKLATSGSNAG